ncbi:SPFH domain-containing protein [Streptomyces sp. NPDC003027]
MPAPASASAGPAVGPGEAQDPPAAAPGPEARPVMAPADSGSGAAAGPFGGAPGSAPGASAGVGGKVLVGAVTVTDPNRPGSDAGATVATAPTGSAPPGTASPGSAPPGTASPGSAPPGTASPGSAPPGTASTSADDVRRIAGAQVGVIAVPVAAEANPARMAHVPPRVGARRKTVIGNETTGSIPVHLLFRDEPEPSAVNVLRVDDDGGPATVAMTRPVADKASTPPTPHTPKALIPSPTRPEPSRPAPTADPKLVERPGPVLPGWIGVVGGVLALAGCAAVLWWAGAVPEELARMLRLPTRPYYGIHLGQWALLALGVLAVLFSLGGVGRGRVGYAWVLTLFGDYRGTVRRTGLVWTNPLLLRRRVDVRLRHWRSEPLSAVDAKGTALDVVVLVVWRIRDTVRAALGVEGHEEYLREQVEAAMARVLSQLPADAFHEDAPTLRDAEAVGEALTRMLSAECAPVGIDVFSAQPTRIEYAPEIAAAMQRRRVAALDAAHRDSVLTAVVDAVDDVVHRLTTRGLVELDDYERKSLVKDLTVAFYTGRSHAGEGA